MSVGNVGKTTTDLLDIMSLRARSEVQSQFGEMPGMIVSYDPARQTAYIKPLYYPTIRGVRVELPMLDDVPVRFPRVNTHAFTLPIRPRDIVTLRPIFRSTDVYHSGGDFEHPLDNRFNALSDMEAHVDGVYSLVDPIENFNNDHVHIRTTKDGSYGARLSEEGTFALDGNSGNWIDLVVAALESIESALNILNNQHQGRPVTSQVNTIRGLHQRLRSMVL